MSGLSIAILTWLLAALVAWLATRPSDAEREALSRISGGSESAVLLLGRRWRRGLADADLTTLAPLRRRQVRSLAVLAGGLLAIAWLREPSVPTSDPPLAERPVPSAPKREPVPTPPPATTTGTLGPSVTVVKATPQPTARDERKPKTVYAGDENAAEPRRSFMRLFGDARVGALYDNEQLLGIRIQNVQPGSFWETLGVEDGDVVLELNQRLMDEPEASTYLLNALAKEPVLILRVRGVDGDERFLEYRTPL